MQNKEQLTAFGRFLYWVEMMRAGETVKDYVLEEKIGAGGVGEVWRARHVKLDKIVAVKFMFAHLAQDSDFQDRFLREAVTMANLDHPNIVSVTDYFSGNDQHCLVMSHVECGSLRDWIKEKQRFSEAETLQIGSQILSALGFAHQRGVIHRDVKPSNILMDINGNAHLTDFGIVLLTSEQRLTTTGTFMGTVEYMSPEQIQAVKGVSGSSDQYSCACVLYEMLTGHPPCGSRDGGDTEFTIMRRHTNEMPPPLHDLNPNISKETESAIMRALEKDKGKRFSNCGEMIEALSRSAVIPQSGVAPDITTNSAGGHHSSSIVVPKTLSDRAVSNQKAKIHIPKPSKEADPAPTQANEGDTVVSNQVKDFFPVTEKLSPQDIAAQKKAGHSAQGQQKKKPAQTKKGKGSYALVLGLAIISGSALAYVLLKDTFKVRNLLSKAEKAYVMGDYETPSGGSVVDYYDAILEIDKDNPDAIKGVNRLADRYLELSNKAFVKRQFATADKYVDSARKLSQMHPSLSAISDRIDAEQKIRLAEQALEAVEAEKQKVKQIEEEQLSLLQQEQQKLQSEKQKLSSEKMDLINQKQALERKERLAEIEQRREESRRNQRRLAMQSAAEKPRVSKPKKVNTARVQVGTPPDDTIIKATPMRVVDKKTTGTAKEKTPSRDIKPQDTKSRKVKPESKAVTATRKSVSDPIQSRQEEPKPKTKAQINAEVKKLYSDSRKLLGKKDLSLKDIEQVGQMSAQIDGLSKDHKLGKKVQVLTLRACYSLGRQTLKKKNYEETQDIVDYGLSLDAKDKRMLKLQKLLDRQLKKN